MEIINDFRKETKARQLKAEEKANRREQITADGKEVMPMNSFMIRRATQQNGNTNWSDS